ncbi:MAG: DNA cytosine methyltransferase [Bryobacteraceae bacterium]
MKRKFARPAFLFPEVLEDRWPSRALFEAYLPAQRTGLTTVELCAGAGGQALGLEQAGIEHAGIEHACLVELDRNAGATLRQNRPTWQVVHQDLNGFDALDSSPLTSCLGACHVHPFPLPASNSGIETNATYSRP